MGIAYAASGEGGEHSIGDAILHHVQDTHSIEIWPGSLYIPLPQFHIFGIDFSITKHLLIMWIACLILVLVFKRLFQSPSAVPSGFSNAIEAMVVFLRDEVITPAMGEEAKHYLPYLLTVFFFILTCNLLGLLPWSATATANISVTAALALISLVMIQLGGIREHGLMHHLKNLVPPGIPAWLLPIMIPVEILGQFTKPFALCIRLYANMTAGHLVILSFLALIFVMKTFVIVPVSIGFALFINILEVFIAFLQAYIFTMLTALFMGMSLHPEREKGHVRTIVTTTWTRRWHTAWRLLRCRSYRHHHFPLLPAQLTGIEPDLPIQSTEGSANGRVGRLQPSHSGAEAEIIIIGSIRRELIFAPEADPGFAIGLWASMQPATISANASIQSAECCAMRASSACTPTTMDAVFKGHLRANGDGWDLYEEKKDNEGTVEKSTSGHDHYPDAWIRQRICTLFFEVLRRRAQENYPEIRSLSGDGHHRLRPCPRGVQSLA